MPAGRPNKLKDEDVTVLRELALAHPSASVDDVLRLFKEKRGIKLGRDSFYKYSKRAGVVRTKAAKHAPISTRDDVAAPVDGEKSEPPKDPHRFTNLHRQPGPTGGYPSSLTDAEWELVKDFFPEGGVGRPPKYPRRAMLDACCYVVRSGCSWRMLPREFPKWQDVYATFRRWVAEGRFERMHERLATMWREREGRAASPTAAIMDSQSVRTSPQGGLRGFDAGKKVKGRKRHVVTDTLGLVLAVTITAASVQDRDAAGPLLDAAIKKYPMLGCLFVDSGYSGKCAEDLRTRKVKVEVIRRSDSRGDWSTSQLPLFEVPARGFKILPRRWVVERTHGWNDSPRRQAKDHDRRADVSTAWIWLTQTRLLARRLAESKPAPEAAAA